ncbi:MAG TPA: MFS transporter [Longimicrobium sp.]|jgi:PAT family beta-lactamase induction signal transducer AmpG
MTLADDTAVREHRSPSLFRMFGQRKMAAMLLLGFASGLPFLLTRDTLQAWLSVEGIDLATLGFVSLISFPYTWKWLWAPFMDRYTPPFMGRRRGWLLLLQVLLMLAIAAMALHDPSKGLRLLSATAIAIAFIGASQDIVFDAYKADALEERELGAGASIGVLGYRVAMLLAGSLGLILADRLSWPTVYLIMAALMLVGIAGTLIAPEPVLRAPPPQTLRDAVVLPFQEFFQRAHAGRAIAILAFIVLYKLGDSFAANMATPLLISEKGLGFTQTDVGVVKNGVGLAATIVGVLAGGTLLAKLGINRSLWLFGILQIVSNLGYYTLSLRGKDYAVMTGAITVENFCAGLGTAAFVAFLLALCNQRFSATQYALLSSLTAAGRDFLASPAGAIADKMGWPGFFLFTVVIGIPGLLLLPIFAPWHRDAPLGAAEHTGEVAEGPVVAER